MNNPFSLNNKTILITGASSGIGKQCAIDCARMGAKLVIVGRDEKRLTETYDSLEGNDHHYIIGDITDFEYIEKKIKNYVTEIGPFNGFIHAAGIEKTLPLRNLKPNDYTETFNTNFVSAVNLLKTISKKNNYEEGCKVVLISSITALIARVGTLAYTSSKGALVAATRELAVELAPKGINVNCISPGTILTPMMKKVVDEMSEEERTKRLEGFPLGIGKVEDISLTCVFLLSDAARWITGQNIVVDGGYTAR